MYKKALSVMLCLGLVFFLAACQESKDQQDDYSHDTNSTKFKIGIAQIVEHPALDSIREGIISGLAEEGFMNGNNIEIIEKNAQGNYENAVHIAQYFVQQQVDMIIAIATPTAQAAAQVTTDIPIVFAAVTDPVAAGLVQSFDQVDRNVTGTSDQLPMDLQVDLILNLLPNIQHLGVLYSTSEVNAEVQVTDINEAAQAYGIQLHLAGVTNSSEVRVAVESLVQKTDAIIIPVDNTVVSALDTVLDVTEKTKTPLFASDVDSVRRGAIATYGIDYRLMGVQTGKMAARILNGQKIAENPVEITKQAELYINRNAARYLSIVIPDELIQKAKEIFD